MPLNLCAPTATAVALPQPFLALGTFWDRTLRWQLGIWAPCSARGEETLWSYFPCKTSPSSTEFGKWLLLSAA